MKNGLQYFYSITVFAGVLFTAYLMMNRNVSSQPVAREGADSYRTEASTLDPAVNQLFEMEDALAKLRRDRPDNDHRSPTNSRTQD